jgi:hypothetical protein
VNRLRFLALIVAMAFAAGPIATVTAAEDPQSPPAETLAFGKIDDPNLVRGTHVTLPLSGIVAGNKDVKIRWIDPVASNGTEKPTRTSTAPITADRKGCTLAVPIDLPLGDYYLGVARTETEAPSDRVEAKVKRGPAPLLKVTAVVPETGFPEEKNTYKLVLLGDGFSEVPEDNGLIFDGRDELGVKWRGEKLKPGEVQGIWHGTHKLEFRDIPASYFGPLQVRLRIGDTVSDPPVPVTLSPYVSATPRIAAVAVTGAIALLVYLLAAHGLTRAQIAGAKKTVLTTLLLDPETDSFSLSKFQLFAWTAVSVFAYTYLLLARSLLRGHFDFAPVPENLPSLLLLSASTTAVAGGITAAKGPKGAGGVQPSLSDFITVGGVVSVERFQFFVWTILGVIAFPFLIAAQSPAQFQEIPKIPDGLLYLMGASSAGYLGGKIARKPGPVIDSIVVQQGSLVLDIFGRCLSRNASFAIEGSPVTARLPGEPDAVAGGASDHKLPDATVAVIRPDETAPDWKTYASVLRLTLPDPKAWLMAHQTDDQLKKTLAATLKLPFATRPAETAPTPIRCHVTVTNPDGQFAVWFFEMPNPATAAP